MTEEELFKRFNKKIITLGNERYIAISDAQNFLLLISEYDYASIGVECFYLINGQKLKPDIDKIADFSSSVFSDWPSYRDSCNSATEMFLKNYEAEKNLWVNIVLICEKDWKKGRSNSLVH